MEIRTCRSFASPRSRLLTVSALSLLLGQTDALAYTVKTTFPRLGGTKIGAPHAYKDASVQNTWFAKYVGCRSFLTTTDQ